MPDNIRFRWAIELYSKTRVKRSIIFTFSDLLGTQNTCHECGGCSPAAALWHAVP